MFFLILFSLFFLFDAVWAVWADVHLRSLRRARLWRSVSAAAVVLCAGILLWWMFARRLNISPPPRVLLSLTMVWHLLVLPAAVVGLGVWAVIKGALWGWRRVLSTRPLEPMAALPAGHAPSSPLAAPPPPEPDSAPVDRPAALTRRQFIGAAAAAAPMILALGATGYSTYQVTGFRVRRLSVPVMGLPAALEGTTIAHVTDTHVGRFTRGRVLDAIVEATNTLDAGKPCDLVLFTGDLINDSNSDLDVAVDMAQRFASRSGAYFVEGNHDLFDDDLVFDRTLRQAGLNLLNNQTAMTEVRGQAVQVVGLQWGPPDRLPGRRYRGGDEVLQASLDVVAPMLDRSALPILLAHHPHALDYAARLGIPLTLSGHTHGGQLMLSESIGPGPLMYRYWSGLYRTGSGASGVISNGAGNWFPLRINAPAEILHLTLTRA